MIFSKSKKAIKKLNDSKISLENVQSVQQGNNWKATLRASLLLYLGKNSPILTRLDNLYFTKKVQTSVKNYLGVVTENIYDPTLKDNFLDLINSAITHIETHGIYKNPDKRNFLAEFNNVQIVSGAFIIAGVVFAGGIMKGKFDSDREIIESNNKGIESTKKAKKFEDENKKLKLENESLKQKTSPNPR